MISSDTFTRFMTVQRMASAEVHFTPRFYHLIKTQIRRFIFTAAM